MTDLTRFRRYTQEMTQLVATPGVTEPTLLADGARALRGLLERDDWLPEEMTRSSPEGYRQYLLHCDPLERFSVVSFVWGPGQKTPVHDHMTWGLVGQLRGEEMCEEFARTAEGAYAPTGSHRLERGAIDRVSPTIGDVHKVSNVSGEVAISIHVYGANIGAVRRHVFDPATGATREFVSGYHNEWVPNMWRPG